MGIGTFFENLVGDVTKGVEEVVPGARQIDRFLNKAGIGPGDFADNPFKPKGWAGDIEHAYSQFTHIPAIRDSQFAAAAILAAMYAPEALPYLESAMGSSAVSSADMASMMAEGSADVAAGGSAATAATSADIAAQTGLTAADAATAGTAATTAASSALPEQLVSNTLLPYTETSVAPQLLASLAPLAADLPLSQIGAPATPGIPDPSAGGPGSGVSNPYGPFGDQLPADLGLQDVTFDPSSVTAPDISINSPSGWQQWANYLTSPKGALTAASTGMGLYSLLNRAQLPGAAKQALGAAGPASAAAQTMISSGGTGTPLWGQQKAAIDAQIDQQIQNFSRAVQQNAQNQGQGGSNSLAVQSQIQQVTQQLETQREAMYMAAQQQNVNNAVAELTGANSTLMAIANLQFQEDQAAQQLARNVGLVTGNLAALWPNS